MSYDIYAATIVERDGVKYAEPPAEFACSDMHVLVDNPDEADEPFRLNERYIPGVSMNMSGGNWRQLVDSLCVKGDLSVEAFEQLPLDDIRMRVIEGLERGGDAYRVQRLVQLLNVVELGMTRGATKLCVCG